MSRINGNKDAVFLLHYVTNKEILQAIYQHGLKSRNELKFLQTFFYGFLKMLDQYHIFAAQTEAIIFRADNAISV